MVKDIDVGYITIALACLTFIAGYMIWIGRSYSAINPHSSDVIMAGVGTDFNNAVRSISSGYWSDPRIWDKNRLPRDHDNVIISRNTTVIYDLVELPIIGNIYVEGSLIFSIDRNSSITFSNMTIFMNGYVEIGSRENPVPPNVRILIKLYADSEGGSGIHVYGQLEIHGHPISPVFTKLASTAFKGDRVLILRDNVSWKVGDMIVITSTSTDPNETEENQVIGVMGNKIILAKPLRYTHQATSEYAGEVADLSRNIIIESYNISSRASGINFYYGSSGGVSFAELRHLGARGMLGKYPLHFHMAGDTMRGFLVNGVSIWDSGNRFISIHRTIGIVVSNVVGYRSIGHGFFLEDGTEIDNIFESCISILTLPGRIRPDDARPAGFWIQNPRNRLVGDIAVSSYGSGFEYAIPERAPDVVPFDEEAIKTITPDIITYPRRSYILEFSSNEAHSNKLNGLFIYRIDMNRERIINVFSNFSAWKNGLDGISITVSNALLKNLYILSNSRSNIMIDGYNVTIESSKILSGAETSVNTQWGIIVSASPIIIKNTLVRGHLQADIVNNIRGFTKLVEILDNVIYGKFVFGYPLNPESYTKIINGNITYYLYRYDIKRINCTLNQEYMAQQCIG
jgi:hypothetical protein